ncbi:MAG: transposase [Actinomycetota bacterium]|nr:transposase [Actinomycetota bacterium]
MSRIRINEHKDMRPPGFRKKETLSTVTFKKSAVCLRGNSLRLSIPKRVYSRQFVHLKLAFPPGVMVGGAQMVRLIFDKKKGEWFAHVVHKIEVPEPKKEGRIMAIDVGMKVFAASVGTDGKTSLYSGGELRAIDRYFAKRKAKCKSAGWKPRSRKKRASRQEKELNRKWGAQRRHFLHSLTKTIVDDAEARKTSTIVLGDLNGICKGKSWGKNGNQKLHAWPFDRFKEILTYKAALKGIRVEQISERGSSSACSVCGKKEPHKGTGRKTRGRYVCPFCGTDMQADVNGARNILKMYLHEEGLFRDLFSGVVADLARPAVNRFVWRDTTPNGHEAGMSRPGVWATVNSSA